MTSLKRYEKIREWLFNRYQVNGFITMFEEGNSTKVYELMRLAANKYLWSK